VPRKRKKHTKLQPTAPLISEGKREQFVFLPLTLLVAAVAYSLTMCPTVYVGDSGELTTAAYFLGIPHSPGYPLYCLLGWLFIHVLFAGDAVVRVVLLKALFIAAAALVLWSIVRPFTRPVLRIPVLVAVSAALFFLLWPRLENLFGQLASQDIALRLNEMSAVFALGTVLILYLIIYHFTRTPYLSFSISLAYAFSPIFWSQAVVAEVYSLNTFLTALALYFLCRWLEKRSDLWLYLASFTMGLALTNHELSFLLLPTGLYMMLLFGQDLKKPFPYGELVLWVPLAVLFLLGVLWPYPGHFYVFLFAALAVPCVGLLLGFGLKKPLLFWVVLAVLYLLPLAIYLYLPIRAAAHPPLNWGNPDTIGRLFETVLRPAGAQTAQGSRWVHFKHALYLWTVQFSPVVRTGGLDYPIPIIWAFGIWGIYKGLSTGWRMARVFVLFMLLSVASILYMSRPTQQGLMIIGVYYLPVFLVFAVFMATGLREWLQQFLQAFGEKRRPVLLFLVILILVLIPMNQFAQNRRDADRSHDYYARDYETALLSSLPPNTIFIVNWDDIFTLWYLQKVEGIRPDVIPVLASFPTGSEGDFWGDWVFDQLVEEHPEIFEGARLKSSAFLTREGAMNAFVVANLNSGRDVCFSFYGLDYKFESLSFHVYPQVPVYVAQWEEFGLLDLLEAEQAWVRTLKEIRNVYTYRNNMMEEEDFIIFRLSDNLLKCGQLALNLEEKKKTTWFLEQAIEVDSGNVQAIFLLAHLKGQEGLYVEARDLLLEAAEIDPGNPQTFLELASLYQTLGQKDLAVQALENVLRLDPYHPDARAMLEKLKGK